MEQIIHISLPSWISGGELRITDQHVEYREEEQSDWWPIELVEGTVRTEELSRERVEQVEHE